MRNQPVILLVMLAALVITVTGGCLSRSESANKKQQTTDVSADGNSAATSSQTDGATNSRTGELTTGARVLEAQWYEDTDGNGVPDFIERENDYDPAKDDCSPDTKCGDAAQGEDFNAKPINVLLMLDASGSMRAMAGGERKIDAAKAALTNYVSNAPARLRFGFLVYGHKGNNSASGKAESCAGVDVLAPLGSLDKNQVSDVMARFEPTGWTPIGAALEKARETFADDDSAENRVLMVSDGIETCGGDPVAVAKQLHSEGIKVTIDVVGFNVSSNDAAQLRRIAEAGGGSYFDAKTGADLGEYLTKQGDAYRQTMNASDCYYKALINARACETKLMAAATLKITQTETELMSSDETGAKYRALEAIREKVLAKYEENEERRRQLLARAEELLQKGQEINRQSLENYDQNKR